MVPNYGKDLNPKTTKSGNLAMTWDAAKIHSNSMDFDQADALFKALDHWTECLEKPSASAFITPAPDKEP